MIFSVIISHLALGVEGIMMLKQLDCEITPVHQLLKLRIFGAINHYFHISSHHVAQLNPSNLLRTSAGSVPSLHHKLKCKHLIVYSDPPLSTFTSDTLANAQNMLSPVVKPIKSI
jgi:hypothetical protein